MKTWESLDSEEIMTSFDCEGMAKVIVLSALWFLVITAFWMTAQIKGLNLVAWPSLDLFFGVQVIW